MSAERSMRNHLCVSLVIAVSGLFACGGALPEPSMVAQPESAFVLVPFPPPPARPEFVPVRPSVTAVWIDGEWRWRRNRWSWVYGRWVEPPEGASFARWTWKRDAVGRLYHAPGTWRDETGAALPHPDPVRLANADEGDVLEDTGILEDVGPNLVPGDARRWRGPAPTPCRPRPDVDDTRAPEPRAEANDDCGAERRDVAGE